MARPDGRIRLLFDADEMRPACVLLQAVAGCATYEAHRFDAASWLTHPTPGMKVLVGTVEEWDELAEEVNKKIRSKTRG